MSATADRRQGSTPAAPTPTQRLGLQAIMRRLESPVAPYYLLLGSTALLVLFGLVMVLSASSVTSYQDSGSSYTVFKNQFEYAVAGVVFAVAASRVPVRIWKVVAVPAFFGAVLLELLVFSPLGMSRLGNTNWIGFGGFTMQPSEAGKVALVLVCAAALARKRKVLGQWKHVAIPVVPILIMLIGPVIGGHDLGTAMVMAAIAGTMLFVAGVRARVFGVLALVGAAGVVFMVLASGNRTGRISSWLHGCTEANTDACYQSVHGLYAMADGGWWGVGLGASREKWSWLPEAHNDFIFAIIGEELGLPGTLVVLALYVALAYACYRLIVTSTDFFVRLVTAGVMTWIMVQATINIGSVVGLLPIIGVPLPLLSSGGSALVTTLFALGILISFARNEPECKKALAARPSAVKRTLATLPIGRR